MLLPAWMWLWVRRWVCLSGWQGHRQQFAFLEPEHCGEAEVQTQEIPSTKSCFGRSGNIEMSRCFGVAPVALPREPWECSALCWGSVFVQTHKGTQVTCLHVERSAGVGDSIWRPMRVPSRVDISDTLMYVYEMLGAELLSSLYDKLGRLLTNTEQPSTWQVSKRTWVAGLRPPSPQGPILAMGH